MRSRTPDHTPAAPPLTTAERILAEGAISIVDAARAEGLVCSAKTAIRWALHGSHGARLESIRVGGRRLTSRAAVRRFVVAQQQDAPPAMRAIDVAAAEAVLAAHGLPRRSGVAR
jgi:hypothetical protein